MSRDTRIKLSAKPFRRPFGGVMVSCSAWAGQDVRTALDGCAGVHRHAETLMLVKECLSGAANNLGWLHVQPARESSR